MNVLWIVSVLAVARGATVQTGNVQWFDLEAAQKHPEQLHILKAKAGINYQPYEQAWKEFRILFNKTYKTLEEESWRFEIFRENVQKIEEHNKLYHLGKKSYFLGVNQFSDLKHEEFLKFNGLKKTSFKNEGCSSYLSAHNLVVPDSVDWRTKGYVTDVKDQGQCGSCWSFSTTGSLEGQHYRKTGNLVSFSESQLVDCSGSFGNEGCNGGLVDSAFKYIKSVGGIESEDDYPYKPKERTCQFDDTKVATTVSGCVDVESGSESSLKKAVSEVGPISVAIDASHSSFQSYSGGVYDEPDCSSRQLDHAVLCVGYDTDDEGQDYWIVKNSWGVEWGDEGYIKMSRNKDNQCGIASEASYPLM
ncbi:procathepsin L-like [Crassostrea angulata]|uniref:procathepsin L-like n=1 Tax=Magallana angulata TaxID=2784310 RepID=UPI0022B0E163|nr:procathepsin L-like [Crassostrea angulata]XP_052709426.1 procathepsin L-like [Crassostrea angulata]XP_052709427.1 procathepsin L-like [Crassostrea angulata]XP_052709428.1 procathepsin L-like [Crassostrea angulata]XP_052709430.1 procathepsin L-like [Crassostrea angulata]